MSDTVFGRKTCIHGVEAKDIYWEGEKVKFLFGKGTQIFPNLPIEIYGTTQPRIVLDSNQKWFEFGIQIDTSLSGNGAAGYTDAGNYFRLDVQWSQDLVNWSMGKFVAAPTPVVDMGGGVFQYWSRCINPQDAAVKTGQLSLESGGTYGGQAGMPGVLGADSRNNPFTSLTLLGVSRALGGFPYTMPTDAGRMQTDLAALFPGSTVEATSDVDWRIIVPNVTTSAFLQSNRVGWAGYLVPDMYGNLTVTVSGADFTGQFVNVSGIPICLKAFARLKISRGTRYGS